jgi:heat shock protein HslJ
MACAEQDRMQQESDFFRALSEVTAYQIVNGELHLLLGEGQALIFTAE